jgi:hypothetical protein
MPLLSIENLPSDPNILPPLIAKKGGRPREKRIRKGALKRKQTRYTNCLQLGHNKRNCVAQPAQNGRAERARNWDVSSSESNSELERELAPFVEQARARARARARAKAKAILAARVAARDKESKFSDLQSSDIELRAPLSPAPALPALASPASLVSPVSPVSPALQLRPKRARKVPARYRG